MGKSKVEAIPYNDESSDDDAPMEITSKKKVTSERDEGSDIKLVEAEVEGPTLFEEVQARKKAEVDRKLKREKRIHRVKKLAEGQYLAQTKNAAFKVVTLSKGAQKPLQPETNFRADLLAARTAGRRDALGVKSIAKRAKWSRKK